MVAANSADMMPSADGGADRVPASADTTGISIAGVGFAAGSAAVSVVTIDILDGALSADVATSAADKSTRGRLVTIRGCRVSATVSSCTGAVIATFADFVWAAFCFFAIDADATTGVVSAAISIIGAAPSGASISAINASNDVSTPTLEDNDDTASNVRASGDAVFAVSTLIVAVDAETANAGVAGGVVAGSAETGVLSDAACTGAAASRVAAGADSVGSTDSAEIPVAGAAVEDAAAVGAGAATGAVVVAVAGRLAVGSPAATGAEVASFLRDGRGTEVAAAVAAEATEGDTVEVTLATGWVEVAAVIVPAAAAAASGTLCGAFVVAAIAAASAETPPPMRRSKVA